MGKELQSAVYNWLTAHDIPVEIVWEDYDEGSYRLSIPLKHMEEVKRLLQEMKHEVRDLDEGEGELDHGEE